MASKRNLGVRFYGQNITFSGLEDYPYLSSISGAEFRMRVRFDDELFKKDGWQHEVDLYIAGMRFSGVLDDKGEVVILLNFGD